jgi:hypothetical protein
MAACRAYVAAYPEPAGTWAGQTLKQRGGNAGKSNEKGPKMSTHDAEKTANLEAIAIVRLIIRNQGDEAAQIMLTGAEDPVQLARSACGLAGALLLGLAPGHEANVLDKYTRALLMESE